MKRFLAIAAGLTLICFTLTFAAEKAPPAPPLSPRVPEMSTAGKVLEISDKVLKIERTLKGKAETMEFFLEKSFTDITVGDQIKVSYLEKDGRNILTRVAPAKKTAVQKPKKDAAKAVSPTEPKAAPVTK
jgi:lipopolysaccharide export system protein LptA